MNLSSYVPPTVIDELDFIAQHGDTSADRDLAIKALQNMVKTWKFRTVDFIPVGHGIIDAITQKLRGPRLIPEDEINDSVILAEAALCDCTILLTSDHHLRDADSTLLSLTFKSCDVGIVFVRSPGEIVRAFG